jgi:beta-glucosidase
MSIKYSAGFGAAISMLLAGCATMPSTPKMAVQITKPAKIAPPPPGFDSATPTQPGVAHPASWPAHVYPWKPTVEASQRINGIISKMTIEEKVGQIIQADLCCVTPADIKKYKLGSILVGGNSGPYNDDYAPAPQWLKAADEFYDASVDKSDGGVGIPIIWGVDAVHGHSNIIGATLFPHNVGLGAMQDAALVEKIGHITAKEIRVTGQEWTFAPTVTVPQDYRWGRSYEGYSSDPQLVASYVGAMLRGLQGAPDNENLLAQDRVIASTKHFLADGGTANGVDQGNAEISEQALRDVHGLPYGPAIEGGVATVMVSFSSWQGKKMTGNKSLLTDLLKNRMGFDGIVISDWNAHGQVEGCTNDRCPQAINAGLDMYMAPDSWKTLYDSLVLDVKSGAIEPGRLDDAVRRILLVKERIGLFKAGKPSTRLLAGKWELLGAPEHRAVAREAVRKSLVLLKNDGALPLKAGGRILVAGDAADDISRQSGGWTITWQGKDVPAKYFPGATTMWQGLKDSVTAAGGSAELSPDGSFKQKPDVAVVVFGEKSYAEFQGDRASLQLDPELTAPFETMKKLKAQGIPVVAVMITGRPIFANVALNTADAFVVAWLPGSEGGGIADVLVGDKIGKPRFDFQGKLPTAWPRSAKLQDGTLYPFGYGLNYTSPKTAWSPLSEDPSVKSSGDARVWFSNGLPASSWSLLITNPDFTNETRINTVPTEALDGRMKVTAADYKVQEGARRFDLSSGDAAISLRNFDAQNISKETNAELLLLISAKVTKAPRSASLSMNCNGSSCGSRIPVNMPVTPGYVTYGMPLKCFAAKGVDMTKVSSPFLLNFTGPASIDIGEVKLGTDPEKLLPCN